MTDPTGEMPTDVRARHRDTHRESYWDGFPQLDAVQKATLPLTFLLLAEKPRS